MALPIEYFLILSSALFSIGVFGVITQRNAVRILIAVELIINAANINFVAFASYNPAGDISGWIFALFIIAVAAGEAAIGLAIFINVFRNYGEIDVGHLFTLREV